MAHAIQLNQDVRAIANKPRGIFHFHLATMLVAKVILAALIFANAQSTSDPFDRYGGWPCKSFRYYNDGYGEPVQFSIMRDAFAANILVCLTVLLVPVAWVEWRCRNGRIADVLPFLARMHWVAGLGAVTTAIALVALNLAVMETPERGDGTLFTYYGWPFTFDVVLFNAHANGYELFYWRPQFDGVRYLILNLYLAAFASLLTLIFLQHIITRFSRNKMDQR